nr:immunoglobulin heavy chain junction region [Macaca mulatta]MOV36555.1 immunoglobulin heavy chain junction region [Macaca mulatta]
CARDAYGGGLDYW